MDLLIVVKWSVAPLEMLDPIPARILKFCRQTLVYLVFFNLADRGARRVQATDIFP
jgi:hypothetical protein